MIDRNKAIVGLFAVLAAASAFGFAIMLTYVGRDACLDRSGAGASCPALAVVNGMRYQVAVASPLENQADLTAYGPISQTNVPDNFSEMVAYRIGDIDPTAVLVAPARAGDEAPYRLLYGPNRDEAYPAICDYFPEARLQSDEGCGAPA
jgi:hypothetical protein